MSLVLAYISINCLWYLWLQRIFKKQFNPSVDLWFKHWSIWWIDWSNFLYEKQFQSKEIFFFEQNPMNYGQLYCVEDLSKRVPIFIFGILLCLFFGDHAACLVASLLDIHGGTEWNLLDNGGWIVFFSWESVRYIGTIETNCMLIVHKSCSCKWNFDATEPLFVQYLSESTFLELNQWVNDHKE